MNKGISVIICCYNSGWIIRRTLEALKTQRFNKPLPYEIVLVDNQCTDDTVAIAEATMEGGTIDFHIVHEDSPGLANARRRGIKEVRYEYVIYCDDDNILCPDYVSTMAHILDCMPEVGASGGKGVAEFECEPADVVKRNLDCYAVGSQKDHKDWLFGAGMALRTNLVRDIYNNQQCYLMGRQGNKLLSGDDSELVMSIVLRGYKIYPTDDIHFTHVLKAERLTTDYYQRLNEGLLLPCPAFSAFRAAIYQLSFTSVLYSYYRNIKSIAWSYVHLKNPDAKDIRLKSKQIVKAYHYWGFLKLWHIFNDWKKIRKTRIK